MENNSLIKSITEVVDMNIKDYIERLSNKYGIDKEDLWDVWNNKKDDEKKTANVCCTPVTEKTTVIDVKTCCYKFTRGKKAGTICGSKLKNHDKFCSKHIKQGENNKEQKINVLPKQIVQSSTIVLKRNKSIDRLWHPESQLVFNDSNVVTHRLVDDNLRELGDCDIKLCKQLGFAYDASNSLIKSVHEFTKKCLINRDSSHDYNHALNVLNNSLKIWNEMDGELEYKMIDKHSLPANLKPDVILTISSLLHDVCDHKYKDIEDLTSKLDNFLLSLGAYSDVVKLIVDNISYSKEINKKLDKLEPQVEFLRNVVSDADKLEAIGEIGIERCFAYEKFVNPHFSEDSIKSKVVKHCMDKLVNIYPYYIKTIGGSLLAAERHKYINEWLSLNKEDSTTKHNIIKDITYVEDLLNDLQISSDSDDESVIEEEE